VECEGETVDDPEEEVVCVLLGVTLVDKLGELEELPELDELPEEELLVEPVGELDPELLGDGDELVLPEEDTLCVLV
jgi:hypothetical protein